MVELAKWVRARQSGRLVLLIVAAGYLFVAWLALDILPGRLYRKLLQPRLSRRRLSPEAEQKLVQRVGDVVAAAARHVPWRAVCFHEGLAAHQMLCHRGIATTLQYGVAKGDGSKLDAHVWVDFGDITVVGGTHRDEFTLLASFGPGVTVDMAAQSSSFRVKSWK